MSTPWTDWEHIVKIDPDKPLVEGETFEDVCKTGTDALEIGGTLDITTEKMQRVVEACSDYDVPLYVEPNNPAVVVNDDSIDGLLVPVVMNAGDVAWISGFHKEWAKMDDIDWARTTTEAYIILNPEASAAKLTEADCDLCVEDVAAYAEVAEQMFGQEIVYIEYSGTFGDPEMVAAAQDALNEGTLFYGGGITDYESANTMAQYADTIVVGNLLHDQGVDAVRETVNGAQDAMRPPVESP